MKGKIYKDGNLLIWRGNKYAEMFCPLIPQYITFQKDTKIKSKIAVLTCGDWCPLFGEPELVINEEKHTKLWQLNLCHRTLIFDEFTDER